MTGTLASWQRVGQLAMLRPPSGVVIVYCPHCRSLDVEHDSDLDAILRRHRCHD